MPELPEVETTTKGINKYTQGQTIIDAWTDLNSDLPMFNNTIKNSIYFKKFKKIILNQKIIIAKRRAKNIIIKLSNNQNILIHLKMTGHIMYGKYDYDKKTNTWKAKDIPSQKPLLDNYNRFVHFVLTLKNHNNEINNLVLSDTRKFAKVKLLDNDDVKKLNNFGIEPLDKKFSSNHFQENIKKYNQNKSIKMTLMDQEFIAGIGNIYSDEILHRAFVYPNKKIKDLSAQELILIFENIKPLLNKGIDLGGDSMSDYRNINGEKGQFQNTHMVYRRKGELCKNKNCNGIIQRIIIETRSTHFCPNCQK